MEKKMLTFLSRHHPTYAQIETIKLLGFNGIELKSVIFPDTREELEIMIDKLEIPGRIVALAAPTWVHFVFWDKWYETIEFVQAKARNDKELYSYYFCKGLWRFIPDSVEINARFIECPISIEEQYKKFGLKPNNLLTKENEVWQSDSQI